MTSDSLYPGDDDLLQALVVREIDEDAEFVRHRFAARPDLAERWLRLKETLADVEDLRVVGEVLAEAPAEAPAIDTSAAVRAYRDQRGSGRRRWPWILATIAAAALVVTSIVNWPAQPSSDPHLGPGAVITMTPDGSALIPGAPLQSSGDRGAVSHRIEIQDSITGAQQTPADNLSRPEWLPTASEYRALPQHFRWRLVGFDGSGEHVFTSPWAESWRP